MMPIWTRSISPAVCGVRPALQNRLDVALVVLFPNVPRGDDRIMLEEDQVLAVDGVPDEALLDGQRLHREEVVPHDPCVLNVSRGRDQIGGEYRRPAAGLQEHDLMLAGMAAGPHDAHPWLDGSIAVEEVHDAGVLERNEVLLQVAGAVALVRMGGILPLGVADQVSRVAETG